MGGVQLYYYTGWKAPRIRFCQSQREWKSSQLNRTEKKNWFQFWWAEYDDIQFVLSDETEEHWDHPSDCCKSRIGQNYLLHFPVELHETSIFTLVDGEVNLVYGPAICICTDLDGTLLGHSEYLQHFKEIWKKKLLWRGSKLIYSTGRNLKDFLRGACHNRLIEPDFAICGVGTEIYTFPSLKTKTQQESSAKLTTILQSARGKLIPEDACLQDDDIEFPDWCTSRAAAVFDEEWLEKNIKAFDRLKAVSLVNAVSNKLTIAGNGYHDPFRLSVRARHVDLLHLTEPYDNSEVSTVCDDLENIGALPKLFPGLNVLVSGQGEWRFVDVLPQHGGKLQPLLYLLEKLKFNKEFVLVCGDSGNDVDMFADPDLKGVAVGNSQPELIDFLKGLPGVAASRGLVATRQVYFATHPCAGGILEALNHFRFETTDV